MRRRVVVTGVGAVTPCGTSADETWRNLLDGVSGVGPIRRFPLFGMGTTVGAFVPGYEDADPDSSLALDYGRRAAAEAVADAGLARGGVDAAVVATHGERRAPGGGSPAVVSTADDVCRRVGHSVGTDDVVGVYGACAAGGQAVCVATEFVRTGQLDVVLAGGVDVLLRDFDFFQFCNLYAMTTRPCAPTEASCPFDARRDGFVLGEGAGFLVLESEEHAVARSVVPLAAVAGIGLSQSAYHMVASPPDAEGPRRAIVDAIGDAGVDAHDIGYVNAHGTSTRDNDWCETLAIKKAFGPAAMSTMVSSTKSMTGHLMGAAGAVETVVGVQALREQVVPPTLNLAEADPNCDLDYVPNEARRAPLTHVATNSFGFGGHNTCVVLEAV